MSETVSRPAVLALIKTRQNSHRINNAAGKKIEDRFWHATLAIECGKISEKVRALPATDTAECERLWTALDKITNVTSNSLSTGDSEQAIRDIDAIALAALKDQGNG